MRVEYKFIHPKFNEDQHGCYTPWFRGGVSGRRLRLKLREVCTSEILGELVRPTRSEDSSDTLPTPFVVTSLTHTVDTLPKLDKFKRRKKESPEVKDE